MSTAQFKCSTHFSGVTLVVGTWGAFEFLCDLWKGDTNQSEHLCRGRRILRLPHADGFAQFHDTSFLMISNGWFVVAVPIVRCCFDDSGVQERANACAIAVWRQEEDSICATHERQDWMF